MIKTSELSCRRERSARVGDGARAAKPEVTCKIFKDQGSQQFTIENEWQQSIITTSSTGRVGATVVPPVARDTRDQL